MHEEVSIDRNLNVIVQDNVPDKIVGVVWDKKSNAYYIRANSWLYKIRYYDKNKQEISATDLTDYRVGYIGIGDAIINWNCLHLRSDNYADVLDLYLVFEDKLNDGRYFTFKITTYGTFDSHNINRQKMGLVLSNYSVQVDTETGEMWLIRNKLDCIEINERFHHKASGIGLDPKYVIFGGTNAVLQI